MEYALGGLLIVFLAYLFVESRRKANRIKEAVVNEKKLIAEDSGMTASLGVFTPDVNTTVIIGASEELGAFYYRMLRQARFINKSKINLANLARIEFLLNGQIHPVQLDAEQPTTSLRATEIAESAIAKMNNDSIRQIARAALKIIFYDDGGQEKTLEITTFRSGDERQRFERVQLLKTTVWWVAFLTMASRQARHVRSNLEEEKIE